MKKSGYCATTLLRRPDQIHKTVHVNAQTYLVSAGRARTAEIHPKSTVLKMALNRYSRESGMKKSVFTSVTDVETWLDSGGVPVDKNS